MFFEEQNLHSMSGEGEMVLTFLASFAQEESRSVSENMKWRIKRDFEAGIIWGNNDCYGYKLINKKFVLIPDEAEIVRRIFEMYLDGCGVEMIAKILTKEGIKTKQQNEEWGKSSIQWILGNYNYTGDLILQKTYRENHLTKKTRTNQGEFNQYLIENDHEPIISKEMFMSVSLERKRRAKHFKLKGRYEIRHPLTSMIKCGKCGVTFRHKTTKHNKLWVCGTTNF